jgi:uncharacterized protein YukE
MSGRVLSTPEAKAAITQIQIIINHGLEEQLGKLDAQGKVLSEPHNWDGPLATTFRQDTWPQTKAALEKARSELNELHQQLQKIATNIMTAGGGS